MPGGIPGSMIAGFTGARLEAYSAALAPLPGNFAVAFGNDRYRAIHIPAGSGPQIHATRRLTLDSHYSTRGVIVMSNEELEYPVNSGKTFAKGLLIGGLIGAAAALLFAPKPGREMRSDLSGKLSIATDKTKEFSGTVTDKTKSLATSVGGKVADLAGTVSSKVSDLASTVSSKASGIRTSVSDSKQEIAATLQETGKKVSDTVEAASTEVSADIKEASKDISEEAKSASDEVKAGY
ncbi:YtxH domain-containing protein [Paenibacillus durus]|nr:YtxH domain-containing protein [Paenibacillus durus]